MFYHLNIFLKKLRAGRDTGARHPSPGPGILKIYAQSPARSPDFAAGLARPGADPWWKVYKKVRLKEFSSDS